MFIRARIRNAIFSLTHDSHALEVPPDGQASLLLLTDAKYAYAQFETRLIGARGVDIAAEMFAAFMDSETFDGMVTLQKPPVRSRTFRGSETVELADSCPSDPCCGDGSCFEEDDRG